MPSTWVGSWHVDQTSYFSLLGVGVDPIAGRKLCLELDADGRFRVLLQEHRLHGFRACGTPRRCSLEGRVLREAQGWQILEQAQSCALSTALPRTYAARIDVVGGKLRLRLEQGGLFGALHDFALLPGACPELPDAYAACPERTTPRAPGTRGGPRGLAPDLEL